MVEHRTRVTARRVGATIVDGVIFLVFGIAMSVLFGTYEIGGGTVQFNLTGYPFLLFLVLYLTYCGVLETLTGQTVGKMLLGIKVVREDTGEVPGAGAVAVRTLLRLIDAIFFYLVAFVVVLVSSKRRRLGDMAAGTLVVRK